MRLYILKALVRKEIYRHLANRGGIALAILLVAAALLLAAFDPGAGGSGGAGSPAAGMVGGVHHCYIEYDTETPLIASLKADVPANLRAGVVFRPSSRRPIGLVTYPPGVGGIHVRPELDNRGRKTYRFQVWHPAGETGAMAPYERWFWPAARRAMLAEAGKPAGDDDFGDDDLWAVRQSFHTLTETAGLPPVVIERQGLGGKVLDIRTAVAMGMVVFALYFACVYLLPTLTCEERERGVLLSQALSPASPAEILTAKFLFYPTGGILLAATIAGIYRPAALNTLFFWLALGSVASGFLGIGMTVACLARTQRAAFMGGMCYLLSVSLVLLICAANNIPILSNFAVEYHGPKIIHAALTGDVTTVHWLHLMWAAVLAGGWILAAGRLFRRRGWQ